MFKNDIYTANFSKDPIDVKEGEILEKTMKRPLFYLNFIKKIFTSEELIFDLKKMMEIYDDLIANVIVDDNLIMIKLLKD